MNIDAHQHFWKYNPLEHHWMTGDMQAIKRDFYPKDLKPLLDANGFDGCIAVQACQNVEETDWLLSLADENDFIRGVVGWVDLRSPDIKQMFAALSGRKKLVGVRHVIQDEPDDEFMLQPSFVRGIASLKEFRLKYDLLLYPKHLPIAAKLVGRFEEQLFVVDHLAKPFIKNKILGFWQDDITALATYPNVYCKLSGMVTEAVWNVWKKEDFVPYLDIVLNAFGPERLMIGSDWPVCTLSACYQDTISIVADYIAELSPSERSGIMGENCARFYEIELT